MRSGCECGEVKLNFPIELVMSLRFEEKKIKAATRNAKSYFLTDELAANAEMFAKVIKTI